MSVLTNMVGEMCCVTCRWDHKKWFGLHLAPSHSEGDVLEALSLQETCKKPGYSEASMLEISSGELQETGMLEELQFFHLSESSQPRHCIRLKKHLGDPKASHHLRATL